MRAVARLTWRTAAFELKALAVAVVLLTGGMAAFVALLGTTAPPADCLASGSGSCVPQSFLDLQRYGGQLIVAMAVLPIAVGTVLGSQLFAREIEHGTAQLPWSLTPHRGRWFIERLVLSGSVVVLLVVVPAIVATALEGALSPGIDPFSSLLDFGFRGLSVPVRAVATFVVAAAVGLALGRTLPALLTAVVLGAIVALVVQPLAIVTQPTEFIAALGDREVTHAVVRDERYRDRAGDIITIDEATTRVPPGTADPVTWLEENFQPVVVGVPGRRYWAVEAASTVILLVITVTAAVIGALLAGRRRPV